MILFPVALTAGAILGEQLLYDSDSDCYYYGSPEEKAAQAIPSHGNAAKTKFMPHESRPSVLSTPGFERDPIILSTPLSEKRSSIFSTPAADFPVWKEGYTPWSGPLFQCVTPVAGNVPGATVLENRGHDTGNKSISGIQIKNGEQPWTIREGQEWKSKIVGKAQKTGTDGHRVRVYREAIHLAKQEEVEAVILDRGVNRFLKKDDKIKPNRRPDVGARTKDGKIHQVEVPSKTDVPKKLEKRMMDTKDRLPENMQGKHRNAYINKEIK